MHNLVRALVERRESLRKHGAEVAGATRDRSLDALGRVRSGALDWHETLSAWRRDVEKRAADARWARLTSLQVRLLDRADRALGWFGERVRAEIDRLARLELSVTRPAIEAGAAPRSTAGAAKPKRTTVARTDPEPPSTAPEAKAKRPETKRPETKRPETKRKAPAAKAKATRARARAAAKPNGTRKPSTRLVMPIADYDDLTAKEILAELPRLSEAQCRTVLGHERANKGRKTIVRALETRLSS